MKTFHIIDTQTGKEPDFEALKKEDWFSGEAEYVKFLLNPKGQIVIYYSEYDMLYSTLTPPGRFLVVFDEPEPKLLRFERTAVSTIWNVRWSNGNLAGQIYGFGGDYRYCQDTGIATNAAELAEILVYLQKKGEGA